MKLSRVVGPLVVLALGCGVMVAQQAGDAPSTAQTGSATASSAKHDGKKSSDTSTDSAKKNKKAKSVDTDTKANKKSKDAKDARKDKKNDKGSESGGHSKRKMNPSSGPNDSFKPQ